MEEVYEGDTREQLAKENKPYYVDKEDKLEWYKDIWPLLRRAPLLSWVNVLADGGHGKLIRSLSCGLLIHYRNTGPNGPGHFFDPKWTNALSDPGVENKALRKGILGRIRLPATNDKYKEARAGQAYPYFMPLLSGDNGARMLSVCHNTIYNVLWQGEPLMVTLRHSPRLLNCNMIVL